MRALGPYERLTRPAVLIGAASGLGASDPRCSQGPHQLLAGGLLAHLSAQGADVLWGAALLGHGADPELARGAGGPLAPQHLCLVGVRSFESEEAALLAELGVKIFPMTEIEERGIDAVLDDAVRIASAGTAGYGISIDLDALEPSDSTGVCTQDAGCIPAGGYLAALRIVFVC